MQIEPECISLPGQINLDLDVAKVGGIEQSAEYLASTASVGPGGVEEESALHEGAIATAEISEIKEQHDLTDYNRVQQTPLRESMYMEIEQSNAIEESQIDDDQEMKVESSQCSICIASAVSTDVTKLDDTQSYLSDTGTLPSTHSPLAKSYQRASENGQSITPHVRTNPQTLVLYVVCAIVMYPFLLALVPFLLIFKLISLLCCCIPCRRHKRRTIQSTFRPQLPLFFTSHPGGYHTIGIELQEQMDGATFVEYVISKLNSVYCHDSSVNQSIVYRLASVMQHIACFSS